MGACTYLGPEFDARTHDYMNKPTPYCGCKTVAGKSYCAEHYFVVYKKGTSINGRRKEKEIEEEIRSIELQRLIAEQEEENV